MNLRELEYLVALAETRHFGKAAEFCRITQSTLSTQIRKLERELGTDLVDRDGRIFRLTPAGEKIVKRAQSILHESNAIFAEAERMKHPESSTIRLGIFPTLGPYLLPHVMSAIAEKYPEMELLLVEAKSDDISAQLLDGSVDIGILALPVAPANEQLEVRDLFIEDFVLALPAGHPLAKFEEPVDLKELDGEQVLLLEDGHCLRDHALEVCKLAGLVERQDFRSTSLETLRHMVASGVGFTLLPRLAVSGSARTANIVIRDFASPAPARQIAMFWRRQNIYADFFPGLVDAFKHVSPDLVSYV
jgi:LysR family hydrogen peroxide-inducible transcriptional activator